MRRYEFLGHMADVRLRIEGDSPEELFQAALDGMSNLMKQGFCRRKGARTFEHELSISSNDMTSLLLDFMAEVLTQSQIHHVIFYAVQFKGLKEKQLRAKIIGEKVSTWDKDVKAVTYHEAEIKKNKEGHYYTTVVFDI